MRRRYLTYQDERNIYMLMEFVPGGELGMHLLRDETFSPEQTKFYLSQVVMAVQYMHADDVIFRGIVLEMTLLGFFSVLVGLLPA